MRAIKANMSIIIIKAMVAAIAGAANASPIEFALLIMLVLAKMPIKTEIARYAYNIVLNISPISKQTFRFFFHQKPPYLRTKFNNIKFKKLFFIL